MSYMYKSITHVKLVKKKSECSRLYGKDLREDNQMTLAYGIMN